MGSQDGPLSRQWRPFIDHGTDHYRNNLYWGDLAKLSPNEYYNYNMTKDDTVIITGDFGGVWFSDSRDDETLDWLERLPFTLAFVCGNHEN